MKTTRRTFLRAAGVALSLPVLESFGASSGTPAPKRMIAINQRFEPQDRPWIDTPGRGGLILNTGVHGFDLMRHLTGLEPSEVWGVSHRAMTRRTEDTFTVVITRAPASNVVLGVTITDETEVGSDRAASSRAARRRSARWGSTGVKEISDRAAVSRVATLPQGKEARPSSSPSRDWRRP